MIEKKPKAVMAVLSKDVLAIAKLFKNGSLTPDSVQGWSSVVECYEKEMYTIQHLDNNLTEVTDESEHLESSMAMSHTTAAAVISLNAILAAAKKGSTADLTEICERAEFVKEILLKSPIPANQGLEPAKNTVVLQLLDVLNETQIDLTVLLGNIFASSRHDKNWEGMYDTVNRWITRNHKAIEQAEAALKAAKGE